VVSDTYRGFTPASMAGNGGDEGIRAIPIFYIFQYVIFFHYQMLCRLLSKFIA
jgi:hypothetical protein